MSEPTRSAAILCGGRATRFGGRDKSALLVDGRTILDRQIAALSTLTTDLLIVGGVDVARGAPHSPPMAAPRVVHDIVPDCGPLGGLHAALTAARGDVVAIVACDMPHVSGPLLAYLLFARRGRRCRRAENRTRLSSVVRGVRAPMPRRRDRAPGDPTVEDDRDDRGRRHARRRARRHDRGARALRTDAASASPT